MEIVKFELSQYESLADVLMAAYGSHKFSADNLRFRDELLAAGYIFKRWAALCDGKCIGFGEYSQTPEMNSANTLQMNIVVHPNYQKQSAGSSLYNRIVIDVDSQRPVTLRTACRADNYCSNEFLQHRGFEIGMTIAELHLVLNHGRDNMRIQIPEVRDDFDINTMLDLLNDANRDRKIYDLVTSIRRDIPSPVPTTAVPYDEFVVGFVSAPSRSAESTFVAQDKESGEYVGITDLFDDGNNGLLAGLTGVRREYRRRGIATALKQRAVQYACDRGYQGITTFNAAENSAIGALNRHFGFIEKFTWLHYQKHF